jgi:group II intron reverse transcriptase/maturase
MINRAKNAEKERRQRLRQEQILYTRTLTLKFRKTLHNITLKMNTDKPYIDNVYKLLTNEAFLFNCFERIRTNKGALTPGTNLDTADNITQKAIRKLAKEIKDNNFLFSPARRILVPKPGKTTQRPITIPNFYDRTIQEGIRTILEHIYEPEFNKINTNFGFRPKKGTNDAIQEINKRTKGMTTAIEGDIKGAFDNVNFDIMINILSKTIKDRKFLRLIKQGFKSGILLKDNYQETTLGIPQGGIASPLLFNIYMHEFDKFILQYNQQKCDQINTQQNRTSDPKNTHYKKTDRKFQNAKEKYKRNIRKISQKFSQLTIKTKHEIRTLQKEYRKQLTKKFNIQSTDYSKKLITTEYFRYADDWILFTNASTEIAKEIKDDIQQWILNNLKLELSKEKTLITNLKKEPAHFLGYTLQNYQDKAKIIKYTNKNGKTIRQRQSFGLFIDIDHERITNRLKIKGFIDHKNKPKHKTLFVHLKTHEIVLRYKAIIEGLFQYYYNNITFKSKLSRYHYILLYSCYKTIAYRQKTNIRKVIDKYSRELRITWTEKHKNIQGQIEERRYHTQILTYIDTMWQTKKRAELTQYNKRNPTDFLTYKVNLRTAFKMEKYCTICGTKPTKENPIEAHHVKAIKKSGIEITGFTEIMRILNRKQITCCKQCHIKIHKGQYNNMNVSELHDPYLVLI